MRREEAQWIGAAVASHVLAGLDHRRATALNLGSGTRQTREVGKPYIQALTIAPLLQAGMRVVHSDLLEGDGIDLSGSVFDTEFQRRLADLKPHFVYFCNVLGHLPNALRHQAPAILERLIAPGGFLFITVPRSYPYHADPIDTMYRPTPQDVAALLPALHVVHAEVIDSESYRDEFMRGSAWRRVRKVLRMLFPFVRPKRWLSHAHRFFGWVGPTRSAACCCANH